MNKYKQICTTPIHKLSCLRCTDDKQWWDSHHDSS